MRCVSALPFAVLLLFSVTLAADSEVEPTFAETGGDQQTGDSTPIESQIVVFNGTSANDALDFMGADGQRIRAKRYYGCGCCGCGCGCATPATVTGMPCGCCGCGYG